MSDRQIENVVIIGSGPAGYTAAIYAARANLKPVVFEGLQAGGIPGGQLMTTTEVENFPGFPEGITGPQLMSRMKAQAERWGTECYTEDVIEVDLSQRPFTVRSEERELKAHSIIIATGATAKKLGLPSEKIYWSNGLSACAICDGASPMFIGEELVVIGGGDSAAEEAVYLTKYGSHVHLLVRREEMRASKAMQDRVLANPKVTVHWNTEAVDVFGENNRMSGIRVRNRKTGEETDIKAKGLFYAIGHNPNTSLFKGQLELDKVGYIVVKPGTVVTSIEGVYAAGDVQDHEYRQAISAAGTGCMAALLAERWLSEHNLIIEYHQTSPPETKETVEEVSQVKTEVETESNFDINATRHYGGYALRKLFHESDRLLIVKYVSPTCGPCKTLTPILNKVIDEYKGKLYLIEIDITQDPEVAQMGQVTGTPTIQFFRNQELLAAMKGVKQKSEFRQVIDKYLGTEESQPSQPQAKATKTEVTSDSATITAKTESSFDINTTRHYGGYALRKLFHESDRLLMVKYVSPTCGSCKAVTPILAQVVDEYEGKIHAVEIDITKEKEITKQSKIQATPTIQFFRNQELLEEVRGFKQKQEYRQVIDKYLVTVASDH